MAPSAPHAPPAGRPPATAHGGWLKRLAAYCLRHPALLTLAFGSAALTALVTAAVPFLVRHVVDDVLTAGGGAQGTGGGLKEAGGWAALLVALAFAQYGIGLAGRYGAGRLSLDVTHQLRADTFGVLLRLDGRAQGRIDTGQLLSRTVTDMSLVQGLLVTVPSLFGTFLLFLASLAVMTVLSPPLTLLAAVMGPALWYVADRSRRQLIPATRSAQACAGEVVGTVEAAVAGVRVVKGFGQEDRELRKLRDGAGRLFTERMRVVRLQSRWSPALQTIPALGQAAMLLLGGLLALQGRITLGTLLAFSAYTAYLAGPARRLTSMLTMVQRASVSLTRVLDLLTVPQTVTDPARPVALPPGPPAVEFDDVRFGYDAGAPVLDGCSFFVAPGETVALVGPAGSGKSTLAALLARFHDPQAGSVRLGGVDLRRTALATLRARTGMAFEESFLFSDTIRANIAYGRPDATDAHVRRAARHAQADGFIEALADGYDTVIGERGLTLSGGQRQRIALARALLPEPSLLVLDDATSAVDRPTEDRINSALRRTATSRTTLLLAHRRSTLELVDRIIVLDQGRVVDTGSLADLDKRSDVFRALFPSKSTGSPFAIPGTPGDDDVATPRDDGPRLPRTDGPHIGRYAQGGTASAAGAQGTPAGAADTADTASGASGPKGMGTAEGTGTAGPHAHPRPDASSFTLAELLRPVRLPLLLGAVLICLDTGAQLALPALLSAGVDLGVVAGSATALVTVACAGFGAVGLAWACNRLGLLVTGRTGERLLYLLRVRGFAQLQRLGLDFYEREQGGRIMTRMTTDVDACADFLQTGLPVALASAGTLVGILVALLFLDVGLTLWLLAMLPVVLLATRLFRRYAMPAYADARERIGSLNARLYEMLSGLRVIQTCGGADTEHARIVAASRAYRTTRLRAHLYISAYFQLVQLLTELARALVLVAGAARLADGSLSAGVLIAYFLYIDAFFAPVQQMSQVFDGYRQAAVGLGRLRELLRTPTGTPQAEHPLPVARLAGEVRLRSVRFRYPGAAADALSGVDLVVRPGETVALVGRTGAGKSTVMKLVARFYDATDGTVEIDGADIRTLDLPTYRARLGVVPQEPYLFAGPVRDAIAYGRPDATDAEVAAAARAVGAHETIRALPGGYHHRIDERGRNLSAGQAQLIALARAELVAPDILLLDEATASLDPATEAVVAAATRRLTCHPSSSAAARTTLIVVHRLTTAARADRIVVLDGGRVVETGGHEELLAACGLYARLWAARQTEEGGGGPWQPSPAQVL